MEKHKKNWWAEPDLTWAHWDCGTTYVRSEVENTLWPHVEEQVEDGEVGQETMLLLIDLIIGLGGKVCIGFRMLGVDGRAVVEG